MVLDLLLDADDREGEVRSREALSRGHNVRDHTLVVLEAPELARAPEADHDLGVRGLVVGFGVREGVGVGFSGLGRELGRQT